MNRFIRKVLLLALCLALAFSPAMAEETALGSIPQLGLVLPVTQEDAAQGFQWEVNALSNPDMPAMPVLLLTYTDQPLLEQYMTEYASLATDEMSTAMLQKELEGYCTAPVGQITLLDADTCASLTADGTTLLDALGVPNAFELGKNEGYTYVCFDYAQMFTSEDEALTARINDAAAHARELMSAATFQPITEAEEKGIPFPTFATTDLNGNPVTSDLFAEKTLTVVNVWGTFCAPCIDEMDELAAWSESMPDNVQLIGLVSDLYTLDDAETLEMALQICEATGAHVYPSLIANVDFADLLMQVTGVPTTFFVDGSGNIVGTPVVGANVPACQQFVEDYLNAQ